LVAVFPFRNLVPPAATIGYRIARQPPPAAPNSRILHQLHSQLPLISRSPRPHPGRPPQIHVPRVMVKILLRIGL